MRHCSTPTDWPNNCFSGWANSLHETPSFTALDRPRSWAEAGIMKVNVAIKKKIVRASINFLPPPKLVRQRQAVKRPAWICCEPRKSLEPHRWFLILMKRNRIFEESYDAHYRCRWPRAGK